MQFEIVDGWLFYTGPAACALAEEHGHIVDWSRARKALDDAGEPYTTEGGQELFCAPLEDGPPEPPTSRERLADNFRESYPQLMRVGISAEGTLVPAQVEQPPQRIFDLEVRLEHEKHARQLERQAHEGTTRKLDQLGGAVQETFRLHLGTFEFQGQPLPAPEPFKALELVGLELAKRQTDLAALQSELDATKRQLLELERAKQSDDAAAEVP